jgi:hypothetical protein
MPRILPRILPPVLAALALTAAPAAAQDVSYRVTYKGFGVYHQDYERVVDEDNAVTGTTDLAFDWTVVYEDVRFSDGALVAPVRDIAPEADAVGSLREEHRVLPRSFSVGCRDIDDDIGEGRLGHGFDIFAHEEQIVLRPAERFVATMECEDPENPGEFWHPVFDLQAPGAGLEPPIMGEAPLDAVITLPEEAIGAGRIVEPVAIDARQLAPARCPGQQVDARTVGCSISWSGEVELLREDFVKEQPDVSLKLDHRRRTIIATVRCQAPCRGLLNLAVRMPGTARRHLAQVAYRTGAGRPQVIRRRFSRRAWPRDALAGDLRVRAVPR